MLLTVFFPSFNVAYVDLSAPIDVYSDWIDAAEAVGRGAGGGTGGAERDDEYEEDGVEA